VDGEASYIPTAGQSVEANRDWFLDSLRRPRTIARAAVLVLLMGLLLGFFAWLDGWDWRGIMSDFAEGIGLGLLVVVVVWGGCYLTLGVRVRRLFRQIRVRDGAHSWRWNCDGVALSTPNGEVRYAWRELHRIVEGRNAFLLFFNDRQYLALPREALDADGEKSFVAAMHAGRSAGA
jgi:hypothetical protein